MDELFAEIERRKVAKQDPCVLCAGRGGYGDKSCPDCIGQGIRLTGPEREAILNLATTLEDFETDSILDQQHFE